MRRPDLSIVIPAYREAKRLGGTLDELSRFLRHDPLMKTLSVEVLVVAADAPDETVAIAAKKLTKFASQQLLRPGPKVGKGRDVQLGMLAAKGKAVVFMDADLATPLVYLPVFYGAQTSGYDVVIGTRDLHAHHPELWRRSLSIIGNILFRLLCGVRTEDSQCGFKMFSRHAARTCFKKMTITGWGFDMEILTIAKIHRFKMAQYRIGKWQSVAGGSFTDGALRSSLASFVELLYIFFGRVLGRY